MSFGTYKVELNDSEFRTLAEFAQSAAGLSIPDTKRTLVASRLSRRMRKVGAATASEYIDRLTSSSDEKNEFISALTTNVSHFFRESHHFDYLIEKMKNESNQAFSVWSAACSRGQEPYSMAIRILKDLPRSTIAKRATILATDIDEQILSEARDGTYSTRELEGLEKTDRTRFFDRQETDTYRVNDDLRKMVNFDKVNLNGQWPNFGVFDAIFCRNVVIYFSDETQNSLWPRFRKSLKPGGLLMLGHSERIQNFEAKGFEPVGTTTYKAI